MGTLANDIRYAVRTLRKTPGFTLVAVLTLALGIGANTAIFSVVDGTLLRALPYRQPSRLVWVTETSASHGTDLAVDPPMLLEWRRQTHALSALAGWSAGTPAITGQGEPIRRPSAAVTANLFPLLGVTPALGRWIEPSDDRAGAAPVVVLSDALWRGLFGADPGVLGRTLTLEDHQYTVIGVARPGFDFPDGARLWTPLIPALGDAVTVRGAHYLRAVGRLAPGATPAAAQADLAGIARAVGATAPASRDIGARVENLQDHMVGGSRRGLIVLLGAVVCVLLVACANVANLMLARGMGKRRELAVRTALGASAGTLARQLLVESLVVGVAAGVIGLAVAYWSLGAIVAIAAHQLPRAETISVNGTVLLFALGTALLTGLLFGLAPAWHAARTDPQTALKEGVAGRGGGRLRRILVVGELATTLVLLAGAGLLLESFVKLTATDPGFVPEHVVIAKVTLPVSRYAEPASQATFFETLLDRLAARPDVRSAALARNVPVSGMSMTSPIWVQGRPIDAQTPQGQYAPISPSYFRTLGIPLEAGRAFTARDDASSPPVAIISAVLAKRLFGTESPLGAKLQTGFSPAPREIVGVVGDVRHAGQAAPPAPQVYVPFRQAVERYETVVLAGRGSDRALMAAARDAVHSLDPALPLEQLTTMNDLLSASVAQPRFYLMLLGCFALIVLGLAAVGVYGVTGYGVAQRTREIGIRIALGAERVRVVRLVVGGALRLGAIGVALGVVVAFVAARALASLLYGIAPSDPVAFAIAVVVLVGVSALASYLPARRAARVQPVEALRQE